MSSLRPLGSGIHQLSVAAQLEDGSGDDRLDRVLGETNLRFAVELAKAGLD